MSKSVVIKPVFCDALALPVEQVTALFVTCEELNNNDSLVSNLEAAFYCVRDGYIDVHTRFANAKKSRGELVSGGSNGLIWQRDRAFYISVARLRRAKAKLSDQLAKLRAADAELRPRFPLVSADRVAMANNVRCSYELYEHSAALAAEVDLFLLETGEDACKRAECALAQIGPAGPGFNRDLFFVYFVDLEHSPEPKERFALLKEHDLSPEQLENSILLSNWEADAIDLVGAKIFVGWSGWIAVRNMRSKTTGPKHYFEYGRRKA